MLLPLPASSPTFASLHSCWLAPCLPASPTPPSPPAVAFSGRDISGSLTLQDFALTDHSQPRKLSEFRGKPVAVYWLYPSVKDVCPTTLAELAQSIVNSRRPANTTRCRCAVHHHRPGARRGRC